MTDRDKKPTSERKLAANRANAQHSTGPKTLEGKARSRQNALRHGLCAQVVEIPGEDHELFGTRLLAWDGELNPIGSDAVRYAVAQAARKSIRLDRCHTVHDAAVAQLVRDAPRARADARMSRIEDLVRLLPTDPDIARRRLMESSEGCEHLLGEWGRMAACLIDPPAWDLQDEKLSVTLTGQLRTLREQSPSALRPYTEAIHVHRGVALRLELNERQDVHHMDRYNSESSHQRDRDRLPILAAAAVAAKAAIEAAMAEEVALLRARKAELEASEAAELSEAGLRARFDASDRGKLFYRYEAETERGLHRSFREVRELGRWAMQMDEWITLAESQRAATGSKSGATPARNEAKGTPPGRSTTSPPVVDRVGYSDVNMMITPPMGAKRRR